MLILEIILIPGFVKCDQILTKSCNKPLAAQIVVLDELRFIVRGIANDCVTRGRRFESSQRIMHHPIKNPTFQQLLPLTPSTTKFELSHLITLTAIEIRFSPNLSKTPRTLRAAIRCPQRVPESQPRLER
jgi:hypothetical protein